MSASNLKPRTRAAGPEGDIELVRYFNDAAMGLNVLFDAAAAGHEGARQELKNVANRLLEAAGKTETAAPARPRRQAKK